MGLRFFADHCIAFDVVRMLREAGHQVFWLRDHLPTDAVDADVIAAAQELEAILVTHDSDFADIVAYPPASFRGIVALQVKNHPEVMPEIVDRFLRFAAVRTEMSDYAGQLLLVEPHRIRIRQ